MTTIPENSTHVQMSRYNWEDGTTTLNIPAMDSSQRWRCAISQATEAARKRFPHSTDRIEKAYELVTTHKVTLHQATHDASVLSSDSTTVYRVNGTCTCPDAANRAPEGWCKHKLSVAILRKAVSLVAAWKTQTQPVTVTPEVMDTQAVETVETVETEIPAIPLVTTAVLTPNQALWEQAVQETTPVEPVAVLAAEVVPFSAPVATVPAKFVTTIKGKPFVQFAGLLTVATAQGLLSLTERVTHVTDTYVMAEARAEFEDGRVFIGVGDSAPDNVGKEVKPHWRRLAGTRAMARALRNALNIAMCSVEELE